MSEPTGRRSPSARRPSTAGRAASGIGLFAGAIGLGALVAWGESHPLAGVVPEAHRALEQLQVWLWIGAAALCGAAGWRSRGWRSLMLSLWLGIAALLAGARELDLHTVLNPENVHLLGLAPEQAVRFRLDWWTDAQTPRGLRAAWAGVLLAGGFLAVAPLIAARYPWIRRALRLDAFPLAIGFGFALLAAGYALDDLLGRPLERAGVDLGLAEEIVELVGECSVVLAVGVLCVRGAEARGEGGPASPIPGAVIP